MMSEAGVLVESIEPALGAIRTLLIALGILCGAGAVAAWTGAWRGISRITISGIGIMVLSLFGFFTVSWLKDHISNNYVEEVASEVEAAYGVQLYRDETPLADADDLEYRDISADGGYIEVSFFKEENLYRNAYLDITADPAGGADEHPDVRYTLFVQDGTSGDDNNYVQFDELLSR